MADNKDNIQNFTYEDYILNPMGKHNAVLNAATREYMRAVYTSKFDNVLLKEHGKIEYHPYIDKNKNQYWIHIKVPSEKVEKFYYDVVIKFYIDASKGGQNDLFKWNVQFFSNDPAFVFTYAHVFLEKNLFVRELQSKMSRKAIKDAAKEKNPENNVGYVKALYFAYLIMQNKSLNKIHKFEAEAEPLAPRKLLAEIMPADEKIEARIEEGKHISSKKKITLDQSTINAMQKAAGGKANFKDSRIQVATTKKVKSIKSVNSTKTTKRTKKK
jgi:hypothetical protein